MDSPSTPGSSAPWRSRPVFVSSTFADMQAERDHLRNDVFPRLEEKLRERRHQFEPIDLRLGVLTADLPDEAAREMHVLKVCLDEIERSRPFLIVLLGDRYGWVPATERLQAAAQEKKYIGDLHHDFWHVVGSRHTLDVDSRLTAGATWSGRA